MSLEKVLYRAYAHATGGRDGRSVVPEGKLDFKLTTPRELGGAGGEGALGRSGWSGATTACGLLIFLAGMRMVSRRIRGAIFLETRRATAKSNDWETRSARFEC